MTQFIQMYENAIDSEFCKACIKKFENSQHTHQGRTGNGVDLEKKNSIDISMLESGVYFVKIICKDNISTKRIVKN